MIRISSLTRRALLSGGVLFSTAMAARLTAQIALEFHIQPEAWEHDTLARNVLAGNGYVIEHNGATYHAFASPLYPLLLAAVYALFGLGTVPVAVFQAVLGGLLALVIWRIASRGLGPAASLVAGFGTALHPGLLTYAAKIHALNLDVLLVAVAVLAVLRLTERSDLWNAVVLGAIGAAAAMERATLLPLLAAGPLFVAWRSTGSRALRVALVATLVAVAGAAPWVIRNQLVLGRPVLSSTFGEVLWRGNNPAATGGALAADGRPMLDASPEMRAVVWGRPELEQDAAFGAAASAYVRDDPPRAIARTLEKLRQFWWFGPHAGALYPRAWLLAYAAYYLLLVTLATIGALSLVRAGQRRFLAVVLAALVVVSLGQSVGYVEGRHRWQVEPFLIVVAASVLELLRDRRSGAPRPL